MSEELKKNINYKSSELEKLYVAINPNIEVEEQQGYVWFNSDSGLRDNAYPNKLIDLYLNASAVHSNFINLKSGLIYGSGLVPMDEQDAQIKAFLEATNRAGQTINDIFKKMASDMSIFEAAALQIIYNAEGKIAEVYHCSPANIRASVPNELGYSEFWYYSTKWGIVTNKRNRKPANMLGNAIKIANFNPAKGKEDKRQILYIKKYSPTQEDIYAIPSYNSILNYVQLDFELGQFFLNKVQNSLSPSGIVSMKGNPTDEEKAEFVKNFKNKHTGSDNAGKLLFMWTDGDNQKPEFIRLEQDPNQGLYDELVSVVTERIAIGHGGNLELAGSDSKGASLGGDANKLNTSRTYYINTVIEPMQEVLLSAINHLLKINSLGQLKIVNKPLVLDGSTQADTNQSGTNNSTEGAAPIAAEKQIMNDKLGALSGKEFINMMRIVRNIKNGKMPKAAGELMLKQSYALDQETIDALLADEEADDKLVEQENKVQ